MIKPYTVEAVQMPAFIRSTVLLKMQCKLEFVERDIKQNLIHCLLECHLCFG